MSDKRHARVSELFLAAVELPSDQRATYLSSACGADEELRREVESLLDRDAGAVVVDRPVASSRIRAAIADAQASSAPLPDSIGGYEVLGVLGQGGMGTVYCARQTRPERLVALKVISGALVTPAVQRRFEFEAHVLARLQHPGIAQIYEAGIAEDGARRVPFFAMELIDGLPLTEYTARHALNARQRLELMLKVCEAVQHAHQKGVIHRDLKPANILVAFGDESATAQPKVLDFGVARTIDPDSRGATLATGAGQIVGTLPYMSPEQVAGDPGQVDTRSDIYSLGVTAYELLAGRRPYVLEDKPLPEAARIIRDAVPPRLGAIDRSWRGDLETIVAKALEKDRDQRYASVSDFAADIQRYLTDQPVLGRPSSAIYQFRKLIRRHRLPAALLAALVFVAIGFGAVSTYQAMMIGRERDRAAAQADAAEQARGEAVQARVVAEQEARTAQRVQDLLVGLFRAADPLKTKDRELSVVELLAKGEAMVTHELDDEPEVQAKLLLTLGQVHENLGDYERSAKLVEAALTKALERHGSEHAEAIEAQNSLAMVRRAQGNLEEAESLLREVLPRARQTLGKDANTTLIVQNNLALVLKDRRKLDEALPLYQETLAAQRRVLGDRHRLTLITLDNIGRAHEALGQLQSAEIHYREAIAGFKDLYGTDAAPHPDLLTTMNNLAGVLANQDRLAESGAMHREVLAGRTSALGDDHPLTLQSMNNLAFTLRKQGELEEAETWMRRALEGNRAQLGDRHMSTLIAQNNLANVLKDRGRLGEAEPLFRAALAGAWEISDEKSFVPYQMMVGLGECLTAMERFEEAESTLLAAYEGLYATVGESHQRTRTAVEKIVALYEAWNRPDRAAEWKARLARNQPG